MVQCDLNESYNDGGYGGNHGRSMEMNGMYDSYLNNNWTQVAESTMPLKESKLAAANRSNFQSSVEIRSKEISTKVIVVNLVSVLINLVLAVVAFYFSFVNNSTSTTAFAADCILDLISSAIVLWRYQGDLNSLYMHAREQIACIYLGALFLLSSFGIIAKAVSDMALSTEDLTKDPGGSNELIYLALVATIACSILTVFKCGLYKIIRDNSILLDAINTLISTVFAMSILMSQALINVNPTFWYIDPILSIMLALLMMGFGIKVVHQNFNILKPIYYNQSNETCPIVPSNGGFDGDGTPLRTRAKGQTGKTDALSNNFDTNLTTSLEITKNSWQKADYSSITFS